MYKFFSIAFYSLPLIFAGFYSINKDFFFDHIFFKWLLVSAILYIGFPLYVIVQNFIAVKSDSFLNKIAAKIANLPRLGFMKITHIANAIAFIWVTFLSAVAFSLFLWAVVAFARTYYKVPIQGLVSYALGSSGKDSQILGDLGTLSHDVDFLIKAREHDMAEDFFKNNGRTIKEVDPAYVYQIRYSARTIPDYELNPVYEYYLSICSNEGEYSSCNDSSMDTKPAVFKFSQDEVIKEFHGDVYEFEGTPETLHRVRVITNKRTIDMMAVYNKESVLPIRDNTQISSPLGDTSEQFEFVGTDGNIKIFNYDIHYGGKKIYSTPKNFFYDPNAGVISGAF